MFYLAQYIFVPWNFVVLICFNFNNVVKCENSTSCYTFLVWYISVHNILLHIKTSDSVGETGVKDAFIMSVGETGVKDAFIMFMEVTCMH